MFKRKASIALLGAIFAAASGNAAVLYGVDSDSDSLVRIDQLNGNTVLIGTLDPGATVANDRFSAPTAMAIRPSDQRMMVWNNSQTADSIPIAAGELVTVDPGTGAGTAVGGPAGLILNALAYSPAGQLYGLYTDLYTIDDVTGAASLIGVVTSHLTELRVSGADFDAFGTLYVVARDAVALTNPALYTVNPATGFASLVGALAFPDIPSSIAFDPTGTLIGADIGGNLYDIDPLTAILSNHRTISGGGHHGLGFVNEVPEPATSFLLGAGLIAAFARRRSRR